MITAIIFKFSLYLKPIYLIKLNVCIPRYLLLLRVNLRGKARLKGVQSREGRAGPR